MTHSPSPASSARAKLVLVIHNHQPTGNFDSVFTSATDGCYERFVAALEAHPHVRCALHYTGPLLEWLERHRPEVIARIRSLVDRGQVEIVGGAWAEPMLSVLPDRDALGQLRTMKQECARLFGRVPQGLWLAERVWDPDLPRILSQADVRWLLLDDTHFRYAGILDDWITGWYRTEKAGAQVGVFPIAKQLRYAIPFRQAHEAVDLIASRRGDTLVYGDDGEKFGVWPDTAEWVWGKGWVHDFFRLLGERADAVETVLPSQAFADGRACKGRIYLPTASYHEMGEWSLPAAAGRQLAGLRRRLESQGTWDEAVPFVRGGIWQNFLAKYSESNRLHKRMIRVSRKVEDAVRRDPLYPRAVGPDTQRARLELYRGQCNCPYWHGLFGGLYLPHLRGAVHSHLIRADRWADPCPQPRIGREDWDLDGQDEVFLESSTLAVAVKPHVSGALELLDLREKAVDLLDSLARRPEIYHDQVPEAVRRWSEHSQQAAAAGGVASIHDRVRRADPRLLSLLRYDELPRLALLDHVLAPSAAFPDWLAERPAEGVGPAGFGYAVTRLDPLRPTDLGMAAEVATPWGRLFVEKTLAVDPGQRSVEAHWTVRGADGASCAFRFATELTVALPEDPGAPRGYAFDEPAFVVPDSEKALDSRGSVEAVRKVRLLAPSRGFELQLAPSPAADLWRRPVETVSQSEEGFEACFQGSNLLFLWPVDVAPGRSTSFSLRLSFTLR